MELIFLFLFLETYAPQVVIKTRISKPIPSKNYSIQCNARGNPLPRLLWSKNNQTLEYYPSIKQCKKFCRIYSIQNKYRNRGENIDIYVFLLYVFLDINRFYIFNH